MVQSLATVAVHLVFSTESRRPYLDTELRPELFAYLSGIIKNNSSNVYEIGGVEDHVHVLCSLPRTLSLAKLVEALKRNSSKWLKTKDSSLAFFAWQGGYGAFSVSPTSIEAVRQYIRNQEHHHQKSTFKNEFLALLKGSGTEYNPKYLWD
ncbi:MAG: IS200/IS605 family transposase [Deltaproteobacteria bacterium]|nr:IS200/IS605 family transposase [Deltaproteobacteria bacterium]